MPDFFICMSTTRIILIGFMGSGKTTLGKKLANKLVYEFIDTDLLIEGFYGKTIPEIFDTEGEKKFRELEQLIVSELESRENCIISVGGGLPCHEDNMDKLLALGKVIYLERSPKELFHRLINKKNERPLLKDKTDHELMDYITNLLEKRKGCYERAHIIANRDHQTPAKLIQLITAP